MSEQKISFNLPEVVGSEITLRTGQAAPAHVEKPLTLTGRFNAPAEYITKRKDEVYPIGNGEFKAVILREQTHVIFDYNDGIITLVVNEFQRNPTTVIGSLKKNEFLTDLGVNTKSHSNRSLLQLIKFKGHLFADPVEHKNLVKSLMKFEVQTESKVVDANDRQGSKEMTAIVNAKTELTGKQINLRLPIFEGYPPIAFQLTIEVEPVNNSVAIYLINEMYEGLIEEETKRLFDEQRPAFEQYVIIDQ